jgi:hypothetical protein
MPEGIIVMKYSNKGGIAIQAKYPEEKVELQEKALMHICNIHEFSKEAAIVSMTLDELNIASFYSGSDTDYFIAIKLDSHEDPDDFEENLKDISRIILNNLEDRRYLELLPSLYKKISESPK